MSLMFVPLRLIPAPVQTVVLCTVLDLVFTGDERLAPLLDELDGRVFHVHVRDTKADFYMGFAAGKPWVHTEHEGEVDARIEAPTSGFARLCFGQENPDDLVFQKAIRLSGDSEALLRFKKLLAAADIDWERELRAAFGDYFGHRVALAARALIAAEARLTSTTQDLARRILRELDIPNQDRFEAFQAGVEMCERRLRRMKARLTRLEKKNGGRCQGAGIRDQRDR